MTPVASVLDTRCMHWFQPYNFPASPCSVYRWIKCSSHLVRVANLVLLCVPDRGRRGQAPRVTSVFHWYDWLPSWISAGIMSMGLFWRMCASAELYSAEAGSGLVLWLRWAGERPLGLMEAISLRWLRWKVASIVGYCSRCLQSSCYVLSPAVGRASWQSPLWWAVAKQ